MTTHERRPNRRRHRAQEESTQVDVQSVWPGVLGGAYKPLTAAEAQQVHATAVQLLSDLGMSQATQSMIDLVVANGGQLDEQGRLHFPPALIEQTIAEARRDVVLYGQDPKHDLDLSGKRVHMSSGGAAPGIFDMHTGAYRPSTLADLYDAARLCDAMENIHHFSRSVVARDVDDNLTMDINTVYAALSGTSKHISVSITEAHHVEPIAQLCYLIAGGEAAFRARPFLTVMVCHVVPPMRFATDACETMEAAIKAGFPIQIISAGQAGATSPATVAGSLVQAVAETLAGLAFARLVDNQVAAIFAPKPLVADLRTGSMSGGGGEQAVLMAAAAQMGRFYDLPTSSIAGITDAKTLDAQYGGEKTLAVSMAAHAGCNLVTQACGIHASLLAVSLQAYVSDNDMLGNILRSIRGVEVNEENLAAEVIASVCHGEGHFLGHSHTLARMKSDYFYPHVGDRQNPQQWQEAGAKAIGDVAKERALQLLAEHYPKHIDIATDKQVRRQFDIRLPVSRMEPA